jgi:hypothetical protein
MVWTSVFRGRSIYDRRESDQLLNRGAASGNGSGVHTASADSPAVIPISSELHALSDFDPSTVRSDTAVQSSTPSVAESSSTAPVSSPDTGYLVHDLLKGLEVSFGIEASQLERKAIENARAEAEKGLPRHDLEPNEGLEVEKVLAHGASHVFADWMRRVRQRIEGAIQVESERVGKQLIALDQQLLRYRYSLEELVMSRAALERADSDDEREAAESAKAPKRRLAYASRLDSVAFWIFCAILVLADFVANVPVFNELLPSSPIATQALQNFETNAAAVPQSYGWTTFWARLTMHLDASILAFSIVLFLVILGHFFGSSLRTIVALHRTESHIDDELLLRHKRQPRLVAWGSLTGIVIIVAVLFMARDRIAATSGDRLQAAQTALTNASRQLADAQTQRDLRRIEQLDLERQKLEASVPVLQARHDYALTIASINLPIGALNLVLALCAALLAYLHQSESLEVDGQRLPRSVAARQTFTSCREDVEQGRGRICELASDIDTRIKRIHHLIDSRPLLEPEAKLERLRGIIPIFRTENSRSRGLDARSIRAFLIPPEDMVPDTHVQSPFRVPDLFVESQERYGVLQDEFRSLERDRIASTVRG